jgi:hypothetical protein
MYRNLLWDTSQSGRQQRFLLNGILQAAWRQISRDLPGRQCRFAFLRQFLEKDGASAPLRPQMAINGNCRHLFPMD